MNPTDRFTFEFTPLYRTIARGFAVTDRTAWIDVGDGRLRVRFGPWRVSTELANVRSASITGPYNVLKTAGPARLGLTDRGLTFATNAGRGVCLEFDRPIRGIDPFGLIRHPNLTVTPRRPGELLDALLAAGVPG